MSTLEHEFTKEHQLVDPVIRWLKAEQLSARTELALPWGICDVVGVQLNPGRVRQRLRLGQRLSIGPPSRVFVLLHIPDEKVGHSIRLRTLERKLGPILGTDTVKKEVEKLQARKFVTETRYGLQRLNGWYPLENRICAIELKLSRVTEALHQAVRHRAAATECYVGLPSGIATRVTASTRRRQFEGLGVGILSITRESCRVVLEPTRRKPAEARPAETQRIHLVERFWRTRDDA